MTTEQLCLTAVVLFFSFGLYMFLQKEHWRNLASEWEATCKDAVKSLTEANKQSARSIENTKEAMELADKWKVMYFEARPMDLPLGTATEENPNFSKN